MSAQVASPLAGAISKADSYADANSRSAEHRLCRVFANHICPGRQRLRGDRADEMGAFLGNMHRTLDSPYGFRRPKALEAKA
jgi:hypothetical protein